MNLPVHCTIAVVRNNAIEGNSETLDLLIFLLYIIFVIATFK